MRSVLATIAALLLGAPIASADSASHPMRQIEAYSVEVGWEGIYLGMSLDEVGAVVGSRLNASEPSESLKGPMRALAIVHEERMLLLGFGERHDNDTLLAIVIPRLDTDAPEEWDKPALIDLLKRDYPHARHVCPSARRGCSLKDDPRVRFRIVESPQIEVVIMTSDLAGIAIGYAEELPP